MHRRTGAIDEGRREQLVLYDAQQLEALLADAGFTAIELREGWSCAPYVGGDVMVALARRPGST